MRDDKERMLDILEAIENIEKYAVRGRAVFESDELVQTWILHHLQILGEAAARISDDFQERHPAIPWFKIVGMRNILVHDYFRIDIEAVWSVVKNDIPVLKKAIGEMMK
jgi:uncharacterized protein with HEPN domain